MFFHFSCDCLNSFRILTERDSALFDIRAGNVDLQHIDRLICQTLYNLTVIFGGFSTYVYNDLCIIFFQKRNVSGDKHINPRILQTNGIEHAAVYFRNTRSRVTRPRNVCHTFGDYRAQTVQVYKFRKFLTGTEGTGGNHNRIVKCYSCNRYFCVHYSSTSSAKNTGPSLQTRLLCTLVCPSTSLDLHTHARHAPMPHAIFSSIEIQHSILFSAA